MRYFVSTLTFSKLVGRGTPDIPEKSNDKGFGCKKRTWAFAAWMKSMGVFNFTSGSRFELLLTIGRFLHSLRLSLE